MFQAGRIVRGTHGSLSSTIIISPIFPGLSDHPKHDLVRASLVSAESVELSLRTKPVAMLGVPGCGVTRGGL